MNPVKVNKDIWYYEFPTYLEFHIYNSAYLPVTQFPGGMQCQIIFQITRRKIEVSLKRMNRKRRTKTPPTLVKNGLASSGRKHL